MAGAPVDREQLVEQVTQLATDHADLQLIVRRLLDVPLPSDSGSGSVDVHVSANDLAELRRLTGGS